MLTNTKVKFFNHMMPGAPTSLAQFKGGLIAILDACLIAGFGLKTLGAGAVVRVGSLVTVTHAAHGYKDYSVLLFAGATQADYNGEKRIEVLDVDHYTFTLTGGVTPASPGTGTITTKVAPLGWTKPYAGTNQGVYRPAAGPRHYLQVDDNANVNYSANVRAYRSMTSQTVGANPYPTTVQAPVGACRWNRPSYDPATDDTGWWVVADEKGMHLIVNGASYSGITAYYFGWFKDEAGVDPDACSMLTVNNYYTAYFSTGSAQDIQQETSSFTWASRLPDNVSSNSAVNQATGFFAKGFDSGVNSVPWFWYGWTMRQDSGSRLALWNGYGNFTQAAAWSIGSWFNNAHGDTLRGFHLNLPYLVECCIDGRTLLRGKAPFIQVLEAWDPLAVSGKVFKSIPTFGAVLCVRSGYDANINNPGTPTTAVIPLGNWEDVL